MDTNWLELIFNFNDFWQLVPLVRDSLLAGLALGLVAGLIGPMIQARDLAFAVHGTSELSFAGAAAALFLGINVGAGAVAGSLVAALVLALMGMDPKRRNAVIGVILPFGLGLGVLFLALFRGRASNKFGLLTGQIVSIEPAELLNFVLVAALVAVVMMVAGRPMWFAALDPVIARAQGVPVRALSVLFMVLLGLVTAMSVQMVGALLVLSLLITPAGAAAQVTASPVWMHLLSMLFAATAAVGGILLSLGPGLPISPYITSISFFIYLICWGIGRWRARRGWVARPLSV